jgi:hypothetical protein
VGDVGAPGVAGVAAELGGLSGGLEGGLEMPPMRLPDPSGAGFGVAGDGLPSTKDYYTTFTRGT